MRSFAKFEIIGHVGKIDKHDKVIHMSIAANYPRKDEATGEWTDNTVWNRVSIFNERLRERVIAHVGTGDLVRVEGRLGDSSYEKDGATVYTVDRTVDTLGVLASKSGKDNASGERS